MPKAPSKTTAGASNKTDQSLYSALIFCRTLKETKLFCQSKLRILNSTQIYTKLAYCQLWKTLSKVIVKIIQRLIEGRKLLVTSQFGLRANHSTTLQCRRLTDIINLHFNNKISTTALFLDIENA
jgi:hypothetical protein